MAISSLLMNDVRGVPKTEVMCPGLSSVTAADTSAILGGLAALIWSRPLQNSIAYLTSEVAVVIVA